MTGKLAGAEKPEDVENKARLIALLKEHPEGRTVKEASKALGLRASRIKSYIVTLSLEFPIGEEWAGYDMNYFLLGLDNLWNCHQTRN